MNLFKRKESIVKTEDSDMDLFDRIDQSYEKFSKMPEPYVEKLLEEEKIFREIYSETLRKIHLEALDKEEKMDYNNEGLRDYVRMFSGDRNLSADEVKAAFKKHKREVYDELYAITECVSRDALAEFEKYEKRAVRVTYSKGDVNDPTLCGIYPQNPMWWVTMYNFKTGREVLQPKEGVVYTYAYYFDADGRLIMVRRRIDVDGKDKFYYEFTVFHYKGNRTLMLLYTTMSGIKPEHILLQVSERWCDDDGFVKRFIYADTNGRVCPLREELCNEYLIEYNKGRQHATHVLLNVRGLIVEQFNFNLPEEKLRYLY